MAETLILQREGAEMSENSQRFLCIASYEKGHDFLREAKRQGCKVFLITSLSLKDTAQ